MAVFSESRRFIAGARCPRCGAEDRLVVYHREGRDYRECVACGSRATLGVPETTPAAPAESILWIDRAGDGGDSESG
ncbi:MAG: hypothetical protein CMK33_02875 [Porticoccaceae bacterium]|jgi:hypothetical protein|nr:hypothetical protein [Porticoccaceae bacterium]